MNGFKGVMKEGWHPKGRDGKKESWRNDFKGINQVAGWMGKGKDKDTEGETHVSRPLSSLKDPSSFGPPPKHVKYHGAAALPNETTPDRSGLGAPLSQEQITSRYEQQKREQQEEEEQRRAQEEAARRPPVPFRANRTGFDASHLPPPPVRRMASPADPAPSAPSPKQKPSVPPRVPPRTTTSTPSSQPPSPPPAYSPQPPAVEQSQPVNGYLNQAATSRLSQAGVSVPALGIGNNDNNNNNNRPWARDSAGSLNTVSPPATGLVGQAPVNELQSRFSQLRTNSSSPPVRGNESPAASASHVANARSAFSDFRSRHSDQIESGKQKLNSLNQKYGITRRVSDALDKSSDSTTNQGPPIPPHPGLSRSTTTSSTDTESLARRKAPPPPPPQKKAELRSTPVGTSSPGPPPLPLNTKPR